jgi:hypothetical protein
MHNAAKDFKPPKWRSGLRHCISVLKVYLHTLVQSWALSQLDVIVSPIGWCTIDPALSELGDGLAGVGSQIRVTFFV